MEMRNHTVELFQKLFSNYILIAALSGWLVAQIIKAILHLVVTGEFQIERLFGDGGMPSCHSATVCALATATGLGCGVDSSHFALAFVFATIVINDAMGVRRETGRQAKVINEMMDLFKEMGKSGKNMSAQETLKELVGHTPLQVLVGATIGILLYDSGRCQNGL